MIKYKQYVICRASGEEKIPFQKEMTVVEAVATVTTGTEVGLYQDKSGCVPFKKFMGAEHRDVNSWFFEYEGIEEEILPLFVAAYSIEYIICKGNQCIACPKCLEFAPIREKVHPRVFHVLESQDASKLCCRRDQNINLAMMLAMGITDEEDIKAGLELPEAEWFQRGDTIGAALELMLENHRVPLPLREILRMA